jgi:hypothetical protein
LILAVRNHNDWRDGGTVGRLESEKLFKSCLKKNDADSGGSWKLHMIAFSAATTAARLNRRAQEARLTIVVAALTLFALESTCGMLRARWTLQLSHKASPRDNILFY